jgi:hypothetical protein
MAYEVVTKSFETEPHAQWSVFFDDLEVPWLYRAHTFHDTADREFTPSFRLPRERVRLDAWTEPSPVVNRSHRFAAAAEGVDIDPEDTDGHEPAVRSRRSRARWRRPGRAEWARCVPAISARRRVGAVMLGRVERASIVKDTECSWNPRPWTCRVGARR